jgi:hypothetical protein
MAIALAAAINGDASAGGVLALANVGILGKTLSNA